MNLEDVDRVPQIDNSLCLFRVGLIQENGEEIDERWERGRFAFVVGSEVVHGEAVVAAAIEGVD